jgi:hypothetical protein
MKLNKFSKDEIIFNTIEANPQVTFTFAGGNTYFNNISSSNSNVPNGCISAFDLSVDRTGDERIYQFLSKDSDRLAFKTIGTTDYNSALPGDEFKTYYSLTSSVHVELGTDLSHTKALKNVINHYRRLSKYFDYDEYFDNKEIKLISIPSIFYGSSLKKGGIELDFYFSGSLLAKAVDKNNNGELIQVSGTATDTDGAVVGIALYNEGFVALFSTASLGATDGYSSGNSTAEWVDFADTGVGILSSSFEMKFKGTTFTPTLTMFAHAPEGKFNFSNNPTFLDGGNSNATSTGSFSFFEASSSIKNIATSSFGNYSAPFKKTTFISKVHIYDDNQRLLGVAHLAEPIRKTEEDAYTFKIKLDL